ncbi:hypothetical protein IWW55_002548 [Coemansia sp. RSA 2706]|nr:hypothetical protein IWW55_002548 [Coemansia sp. RSA 2706]KAJ2311167.1 hypothetical protein IWW54_002793 [Coemansia sp. RSA 2705]KAJ2318702.1 hypothetical protein IWW52_002407 [Coemansia sp. RSA 2704]
MSVAGPSPSAHPPSPARKLRKAFKSSAFIPPEWRFENNADGVIGLITEVVMAVDRQRMFKHDQNVELRQHIHHTGDQMARGLDHIQRSQQRGQHGSKPRDQSRSLSGHRGPSQSGKRHGHHRSQHHGQQSSQSRGDHQRSRNIQGQESPYYPNGYGNPNYPTGYDDPGYPTGYGDPGYPAGYGNPGYPAGYDPAGYQHTYPVQEYDPYHQNSHSGGRRRSRDPHEASASHVNIDSDRHSVFSKATVRKRTLPRGTRAVTSDSPVATRCPQCKESVMTVIKRHTGAKNIAATAAVAAAGVAVNAPATLLPLALAVLDMGSLKRKAHHCPYCDYRMGKHVTITIPRD